MTSVHSFGTGFPLGGDAPSPNSVRASREQRRTATAHMLRGALAHYGSHDATAKDLGIRNRTWVTQCLDVGKPDKQLALADAAGLEPRARLHVTRWLAALDGHVVVSVPKAGHIRGTLKDAARAQRESAEAVAAHLDALDDDFISPDEAERVIAECNEAMEAMAALREVARRAQRTRGLMVKGDE